MCPSGCDVEIMNLQSIYKVKIMTVKTMSYRDGTIEWE
jgi:hypothetical protein